MQLVTICPSGIIGPGFYRHTPTTQPFEMAVRNKIPFALPFGFGYVDVRDVAKAHLLAYENKKAVERHIASTKFYTMVDLLKELHDLDNSIKAPSFVFPVKGLPLLIFVDWIGHKMTGQPRQITRELVKEFGGKYQRVSTEKILKRIGMETNGLQADPH